jgi:hypothetical protein
MVVFCLIANYIPELLKNIFKSRCQYQTYLFIKDTNRKCLRDKFWVPEIIYILLIFSIVYINELTSLVV